MKLIFRILITSLLVIAIASLLNKSIVIENYTTAIYVAIVLGLLNIFVKPIFVFFTLPATIVTLGLFLLVINATMVMICDNLLSEFHVKSFWSALLFSILLSISESIVYQIIEKTTKKAK